MTRRTSGKTHTKRAGGLFMTALILLLGSPLVGQAATPNEAPRAPRTVLVSIPDRKLAVLENGTVLAEFAISVGAEESPSPTGEFKIVSRVTHPAYYHQGQVIPSGKGNPVGTRWIGLSEKGYGIHGTNAPKSIGQAASHGCIRLRNRDVEKLFSMLRLGDVVNIRGEQDEQTADVFGGAEDDASGVVAEVTPEAAGVEEAASF